MNTKNQYNSKNAVGTILVLALTLFANQSYAEAEICYTSGAYSKPIYGKQQYSCQSFANSISYVSQAYTKFNPSKDKVIASSQSSSQPQMIYVSRAYNKAIFSYGRDQGLEKSKSQGNSDLATIELLE